MPVPYIYGTQTWVITASADVLESNNARPSSGTVLTEKCDMLLVKRAGEISRNIKSKL